MLFAPRKYDNIAIEGGYTAVMRLDIFYDGSQSSEWTRFILAYYDLLSDLEAQIHILELITRCLLGVV
jgi:hypothetical protein